MLTPIGMPLALLLAGMTSATGRCHTFDARPDGYARSEACTAISLAERHLRTWQNGTFWQTPAAALLGAT